MPYYPLLIAFFMAALNWIAVEKKWKALEYVAKPGTMLILIWWIWSSNGLGGSMIWFTLGVIFCLAGDVLLMVPRDLFILGLLAFLLGHIFFILGFNDQAPYIHWWGAVIVILLGIYVRWLYPKLLVGLKENGKSKLSIPVLIYAVVISLMVYSALMTWTRPGWLPLEALFASLGAILFYASDSILAWDRFIRPLSHARLKTMVTYHLGQFGIILAAIVHLAQK
ncbi:MAG: hypothetical protein A2136_07350 [Chloroflexi bacterium RBG_16_54_11]|nr:MAG: hypothetical protein A2136_07350 [Chloroflexi bacterium RBG_16_54_11]